MERVRSQVRLVAVLALLGCDSSQPRAANEAPPHATPAPERFPDAARAQGGGLQSPSDAGAPRGAARAPTPAPSASAIRLRRAAALASERVVAVGADGTIYRRDGARWLRVPLAGAVARDVVAAQGALWVLARGTGENTGAAIVLRTPDGAQLTPVATANLGAQSEPEALGVAGTREYYIGGASPALVRLLGADPVEVPVGAPRVLALRVLRNDLLVALHGARHVTVTRWGEGSAGEVEGLVDVLAEPDGRGTTVLEHGVFQRGRPGRIAGPWTTECPIASGVAAVLGGVRPALAGHGGVAVWEGNAWHAIAHGFPAEPVAVLDTDPPMVVGADGAVVALVNLEARTLVPAGGGAR